MTMKEFLNEIDAHKEILSEDARTFLKELIEHNKSVSVFTEAGAKIIKTMQENEKAYLNSFSAKQLGELLFMAPRSVSGSMKKLINDGYVEKKGTNPISYGLTSVGKEHQFDI